MCRQETRILSRCILLKRQFSPITVVSILSKRYLIMFNHEVRTQGTALRALTTFITILPFTKCKDFPSETPKRRYLVPIMLLQGTLFLQYRILATLTVLMNTIEVPPFSLMQGELLPVITNQAPGAWLSSHTQPSEICHFHNTTVGAWILCFNFTLICLKEYISVSSRFLFLQLSPVFRHYPDLRDYINR